MTSKKVKRPTPQVSILIPTRNEGRDIARALDGVLVQDLPHEAIEVIVVDGDSADDTAEIVSTTLSAGEFSRVEIVNNPIGTTPSNLNVGLSHATAPIICRVDARSVIPPHYVRRCVEMLNSDTRIVVVGGSQVALSGNESTMALGITRALNNRWGMGLAKYRRGAPSGATDTVYLGAFRTEQLRAAGGWDERFETNQDFELNRRLGQAGTVWFEGELEVGYLPRSSIGELFRQYRRFGNWKVRYWQIKADRPRGRQVVLIAAPALALAGAGTLAMRRPRLLPTIIGTAILGTALIEMKGSDQPRGGISIHVISAAALAAVGLGWTIGVWESLICTGWRRSRSGMATIFHNGPLLALDITQGPLVHRNQA